jgi:DNA repair protein RecO (recombination protein O)
MLYNPHMPSRERSIRVEAVVLRHSDWGEADRLVGLFTRQLGKIRAIAKGVRKMRSRKAGHLEPFTRTSLLLARGRDMFIITQAETIQAHSPLREDLLLVGYASYVIELLDRFTYEEGENRALYRLLVDTLGRLSTEPDPILAVRYYEIRLLDLLGFRPQLFTCAHCGKEIIAEDQYFSAQEGGVLCPDCGRGTQGARPISMLALKYLRHLQRSSYAEAYRAQITPQTNREMEVLIQHYLTYLLERGLNSPHFIQRIKRDKIISPDPPSE